MMKTKPRLEVAVVVVVAVQQLKNNVVVVVLVDERPITAVVSKCYNLGCSNHPGH